MAKSSKISATNLKKIEKVGQNTKILKGLTAVASRISRTRINLVLKFVAMVVRKRKSLNAYWLSWKEAEIYGSQIVAKFNNKNSYQNQQFDT